MFPAMAVKSGSNIEARDRSRAAILQAGADLIVEHASRHPFAALRLRGLCDRAGYSTGAFYVHWASLDEYYDDLAKHLSGDEMFGAEFQALAELADCCAELDAVDAIARVADEDLGLLVRNEVWDAEELMNVTWGRTRYRERTARGYEHHDKAGGEIYGSILARKGREPRPPLDWDQIGRVIQAIAEGLGLRYKIDPNAVPPTSDSHLGIYAMSVAAVLAVLTRPIGDDTDANEAIRALLQTSASAAATTPDHSR